MSQHLVKGPEGSEGPDLTVSLDDVLDRGDAEAAKAKQTQETADAGRASHLHNGDAVSIESPAAPLSQRFERGLAACPFGKYDRP
jgi:hypothetical protein